MAMTPRPRTPITPYPGGDTAAIKELLSMMKTTLGTLGTTFQTLNEQSEKVNLLSPAADSTHQIQSLRRQMRAQDKKQDARINEVKHMVKEVLKDQIADHMRTQIEEQIRAEIALQVRQQVAEQLGNHLPVPLEVQAEESRKQLFEVKHSLVNSEARRSNSVLRANNIDDPLAHVYKPDGTKSDHFPPDLKTLFAYDADKARSLVQDFGLPEHEVREKNLNRFMAHIGIPFHLIPVPMLENGSADGGANALGIQFNAA
ncbi:hypothetical protein SISNIDRAFT_532261 [Sistotremastrum niveocremeum HHB9708]|uniref:Uncharacterized protein n=2 Tax=Sistotremastraceae TaxID=3402574 RepID=A0A164P2J0_9AGAM|nr:hypothetical protein SISNIDRAFT_532261 [Sistotremastrum niveocremeum HHB9708]KZT39344.1 hypothetical protein SISSUDRAFT_654191 [Sistotremastrum suecicum HHB10207 ss-3]